MLQLIKNIKSFRWLLNKNYKIAATPNRPYLANIKVQRIIFRKSGLDTRNTENKTGIVMAANRQTAKIKLIRRFNIQGINEETEETLFDCRITEMNVRRINLSETIENVSFQI